MMESLTIIYSGANGPAITVLDVDPPLEEDEIELDIEDLDEEPAIHRARTRTIDAPYLNLLLGLMVL